MLLLLVLYLQTTPRPQPFLPLFQFVRRALRMPSAELSASTSTRAAFHARSCPMRREAPLSFWTYTREAILIFCACLPLVHWHKRWALCSLSGVDRASVPVLTYATMNVMGHALYYIPLAAAGRDQGWGYGLPLKRVTWSDGSKRTVDDGLISSST
jgi:hypothetical protein